MCVSFVISNENVRACAFAAHDYTADEAARTGEVRERASERDSDG